MVKVYPPLLWKPTGQAHGGRQQSGSLLQLVSQLGQRNRPGLHRQLLQTLDPAHGLYILLNAPGVDLQPVQCLFIPSAPPQQLHRPLEHSDRVAQVVGKGGVEPLSLLRLPPQLLIAPQ